MWFFSNFCSLGIALPFIPVLLEEEGLTPSQIGLVFAVNGVASALFSYYIGGLSDRVGRLRIIQASTAASAILYPTLAIESGVHTTILALVALMMASGGAITTFTAYTVDVIDRFGSSRGRGFGSIRIAGSIGWVPGNLLGGYLVDALGIRSIFISAGVIMGVAVAATFLLEEEKRVPATSPRTVSSIHLLRGQSGMLLVISTLSFMVNVSIANFLSLHMVNTLNATAIEVSAAYAVMGIAEVPAMVYLGRFSDEAGRRLALLICLAAFPVRLALTGLADNTLTVIAAQTLQGLTFGGLYVVSIAYATDILPAGLRGAFMGLYGASFNAGGIIGGYVWGVLAEAYSYPVMFYAASLLSLLPLGLGWAGLRSQRVEVCPAPAGE